MINSTNTFDKQTDLKEIKNEVGKKLLIPTSDEITKYIDIFEKYKFPTKYVPAILMYWKHSGLDMNTIDIRTIHSQLNYKTIEMDILYRFYLDKPKSDYEINSLKARLKKGNYIALDVEIACCHYILDQQGLLSSNHSSKNMQKVIADLKNKGKSENLVAIKMLIDELENNFVDLLKLDKAFLKQIVLQRPLIALVMLTKTDLNEMIMREYKDKFINYIENEDVYKSLVPFIHIHIGKTHGQWRHLSDPSKTCIVLTTRNCKIASSKNTQKSYDKSETEGKFLVLQGLSIQADSDNAEVHYLEV